MNSSDLLDHFRTVVFDTVDPFLWGDTEIFRYMDDAYFQFVRLTGGISDFTSAATVLAAVADEAFSDLDPSLLTIRKAYKADGRELQVLNAENLPTYAPSDYGRQRLIAFDTHTGPLCALVVGLERGKVRWTPIPAENEDVQLLVYRLPFEHITDTDQEFTGVEEQHHIHLVERMKELAYLKEDKETYDPKRSVECGGRFRSYCDQVKREWERYKHKPRTVAYGGI